MAEISGRLANHSPTGNLQNWHSSNPQPMGWEALSQLTGVDFGHTLMRAPMGYEALAGRPSLRRVLCEQHYPNLDAENLVTTSGAQEGIFLVMQALLQPGDQVIAFTPCFEPLVTVAAEAGAEVITLPLTASSEAGWTIDWQQLARTVSPDTKMLVINFPHNPTGCHISQTELDKLVAWCDGQGCWLFSDEVFRGLEHQPEQRIAPAATLYDRAISMGVMSKALGLPGIRLGWIATQNQALINRVTTIKSHLSICQSSLDAEMSQAIIPHSEAIWQHHVNRINNNKDAMHEIIQDDALFSWHKPVAAATGFVQLNGVKGEDFADQMATTHQIMVLPNVAFLTELQGFRITLGGTDPSKANWLIPSS